MLLFARARRARQGSSSTVERRAEGTITLPGPAGHRCDACGQQGVHVAFERLFTQERRVRLVVNPNREQLADLYSAADVFATASTSHYETFGRAPAEALACGTVAIAPRYDGFVDVLAQPGGRLVDVEFEDDLPRANR